jgi:hypothetical protein
MIKRVALRTLKREETASIDDRALFVAGRAVSEEQFDECVIRAFRHLASRGEFSPNKTAAMAGLDASFLRRVMQRKRSIGLFTLFKIASVSSSSAQDVVALIAEELRKEVAKQ